MQYQCEWCDKPVDREFGYCSPECRLAERMWEDGEVDLSEPPIGDSYATHEWDDGDNVIDLGM